MTSMTCLWLILSANFLFYLIFFLFDLTRYLMLSFLSFLAH